MSRITKNLHFTADESTDHDLQRTVSAQIKTAPFFKSQWMNDACQRLMKPNLTMDQLGNCLEKRLAYHLKVYLSQNADHLKRQALFTLLGYSYVKTFLPEEIFDPSCLEPPKTSSDQKEKVVSLARTHLSKCVGKTCDELGLNLTGKSMHKSSDWDGIQQEANDIWKEAVEKHVRDGKKLKVKNTVKERSKKGIKLEEQVFAQWVNADDIVGQAVAEICECDATKLQELTETFTRKSYTLPAPLRLLIIQKQLFVKHGDKLSRKMKEIVVWRDSFKNTVTKNAKEMKLARATRSHLSTNIDSAIIEVYGRIPTLKLYDTDAHDVEAAQVLNVLHVYNKAVFDPTMIIWLFPLQMIFANAIKDEDAIVLELAMYLDLLSQHCIPSVKEITELAKVVIETWQQWDPDLYKHVIDAMNIGLWVNPKDFPLGILSPDKVEAQKIYDEIKTTNSSSMKEFYQNLLTQPSLFVRKWIAEGFVSILNLPSIFFVWDQLFLNSWSSHSVRDVCLTLLFLLKHRFTRARNYFNIRDVFLTDPSHLATSDICSAWAHIHNGESFEEIPEMNRNAKKLA